MEIRFVNRTLPQVVPPLEVDVTTGGVLQFTTSGVPTLSSSAGILLKSPDGTVWLLTIDNSGNLSATST